MLLLVQLRKFDEGRGHEFFQLWQQYVPASMLAYDESTRQVRELWTFLHRHIMRKQLRGHLPCLAMQLNATACKSQAVHVPRSCKT